MGWGFRFLWLCRMWTVTLCLWTPKLCEPQKPKGRHGLPTHPHPLPTLWSLEVTLCQLDAFEARGSQSTSNSRWGQGQGLSTAVLCPLPHPCLEHCTNGLPMEGGGRWLNPSLLIELWAVRYYSNQFLMLLWRPFPRLIVKKPDVCRARLRWGQSHPPGEPRLLYSFHVWSPGRAS